MHYKKQKLESDNKVKTIWKIVKDKTGRRNHSRIKNKDKDQ
jgi:hypothetical protein